MNAPLFITSKIIYLPLIREYLTRCLFIISAQTPQSLCDSTIKALVYYINPDYNSPLIHKWGYCNLSIRDSLESSTSLEKGSWLHRGAGGGN